MADSSTASGLKENLAALLCYLLWWISGIIFLIIESKNKTIKFHAIQSIIIFGILFIVSLVLSWVPFVGFILWILSIVLWVFMMYKAYQGGTYHLPIAGQLADKFVK